MDTFERILDLKKKHGMRDVALERAIGVPGRTIDAWKRGLSRSYVKHIPAFARVFNVSTDYLLCMQEHDIPPEMQVLARKAEAIPEGERGRIMSLLNATMDTFLESREAAKK